MGKCKECYGTGLYQWHENHGPGLMEPLSEPCVCVSSKDVCPQCGKPIHNYLRTWYLSFVHWLWQKQEKMYRKLTKDKNFFGISVRKTPKKFYYKFYLARMWDRLMYKLPSWGYYDEIELYKCKYCGWKMP